MKFGVILTAGSPREQVQLAADAEAAGWDGVFTYDAIAIGDGPMHDPWTLLAAFATATRRVTLGAIVFAPTRRRPWKLAREATTIDHLSDGRLVLPVGLGALDDRGFANVGEVTGTRARAERLDETLAILDGLWSGEPFEHHGAAYDFGPMTFRPTPVQRPRIPIWVVVAWPHARSVERALRWDGMVLQTEDPVEIAAAADLAVSAALRPTGTTRSRSPSREGHPPTRRRGRSRSSPSPAPAPPGGWRPTGPRRTSRASAPAWPRAHRGYPDRRMPRTLIDLAPPVERAFLVAVDTGDDSGWGAEESLAELASLALTAGADVVGAEWQNRRHVDPNWYVGKGKAEELVAAKSETHFDLLVADDELSPGQQRALEGLLNVKVIDRSRLILDIFAQHARTHEGRLQVELAQLEYQLPRLTRLWTHLSRTGGGIGTRGPGESQLETDRRLIRERIKKMKGRVDDVRRARQTSARGRDRRLQTTVGIVGYTNAGKSTLLNALVGQEVALAEDKLFATLDPTSRQVKLGDGQAVIVTDTVGFIHKLPHQLVDAFRATLEEVNRADVLLEVVDAADPHFAEHRTTVQAVLDELGAGDKPRLVVFNKADLLEPSARDGATPAPAIAGAVFVSALTGYGLATLRAELAALLASLWVEVDVHVPYAAGELLARVRERGTVELDYGPGAVHVTGRVAGPLAAELESRAVAAGSGEGSRPAE